MKIFEYFENLRRQPEGEKRRKVFLISLYITLGIALIWGVGLYMRVSSTDFSFKTEKKREVPGIKETFSSFFGQIENIINNTETYENPAKK